MIQQRVKILLQLSASRPPLYHNCDHDGAAFSAATHDSIKSEKEPRQWAEGLPLGNGEIGVMCWSDGRQLRFTLDSASAWDLCHNSAEPDYSQLSYDKLRQWVADGDYDAIQEAAGRMGERDRLRPTKLYLGRFDLDCEFEADSELSLRLADASVCGVLTREAPFTINETCGVSCGIADMLVQGWGDCIRVFPATPARWQDVLFVDLLTEGAFRVSGLSREGQVRWVRITAEVDGLCRLRNPFEDSRFVASGCTPRLEDGLLTWPLTSGQTVSLSQPGFEIRRLQQEAGAVRELREHPEPHDSLRAGAGR